MASKPNYYEHSSTITHVIREESCIKLDRSSVNNRWYKLPYTHRQHLRPTSVLEVQIRLLGVALVQCGYAFALEKGGGGGGRVYYLTNHLLVVTCDGVML